MQINLPYPKTGKQMSKMIGEIEELMSTMRAENDGQLLLPFGPPIKYTIMWHGGGQYLRPLRMVDQDGDDSVPTYKSIVLARPLNAHIRPDGDGDYKRDDFEIGKTVSLQDIYEFAQANPDKTLEDFLSLKFMEGQMGL